MSIEEIVVVSGSADRMENTEEVNNEDKTMVAVNSDGNQTDGDKSNENAISGDEMEEGNVILEEENNEEVALEVQKDKGNLEEEQNKEKIIGNSNGKGRRPRKTTRKNKAAGKDSEIATTDGDKPESSSKKDTKRVESMGMIFMCSSKTKKDCFRYKILGLPSSKKDQVQKIYKGMRLFLFDVDLRLMYGIFKAAGPGGYNIEPKAFKSAFPSQVRFTVMEDCLPLAEEKFKKVIKENYYTKKKFDCLLNSEQVKKLCKLFVLPGKGPSSKKLVGSLKAEAHTSVDQKRRKRRVLDEERRPASGRERRVVVRPAMYEREVFAPPVAPLPRLLPLRPPAHAHSYAYEREMDMASLPPPASVQSHAYERTTEVDRYVRDPAVEHRGLRFLDSEPRRREEYGTFLDSEPRRREEYGTRDPYILYREPPPPQPQYRDTLYYLGQSSEYHPPTALPPEYRLVSRDYPSLERRPAEYHASAGLRSEYRAVGPSNDYHSSVGTLPDYHHRTTHYRY